MAREVLFDTSGFFALMDERDVAHTRARSWIAAQQGQMRPLTTEWIIGETCTLLVARKRPHLVAAFLNHLEQSDALLTINPDEALLASAKELIRRQAEQGYSFVDCLSFCLMRERDVSEAFTTDEHFRKAGFSALLTGT
jgi:predicted nucleic acid-binding protein